VPFSPLFRKKVNMDNTERINSLSINNLTIMHEKLKSEGKCLFCGKTFAKAGINRHLATHLKEKVKSGEPDKSFFVKIETNKKWGSSPYFLSLWIDGEAKMKDLDNFLRGIWLECCGHMSAFRDPQAALYGGEMAEFDDEDEDEDEDEGEDDDEEDDDEDEDEDDDFFGYEDEDDVPMSSKAKNVLYKGLELEYEYDFGSSTELTVTVMDEYPVKAEKTIVLLSRNEPLKIMCNTCDKAPATQICTTCVYEGPAMFCDKCAKKHAKKCEDFVEYASMPVVNSPRAGVCGYDGGTIDTERDGVFDMPGTIPSVR
jgi:hypothetical protein